MTQHLSQGSPRPRVDLRSVHRLLIRFAIALSIILVVYGLGMYLGRGNTHAARLAIVGGVAFVVWVYYLRWFNRKDRAAS